jgi:hypothetical protein
MNFGKNNKRLSVKLNFSLAFIFTLAGIPLISQNPVELGTVKWQRDIHQAVTLSKQSGKPVFILFQEIPGCLTCRRYGSEVLSHPLLVEGLEQEFIPLAIYNNKGGEDARVLKQFGEPAWNNPVVRIVDAGLNALVPRLDGDYSPAGVLNHMILSLSRNKKTIPQYLRLALEEASVHQPGQLSLAMSCFWEGEKRLGLLEGILGTEPGFIQGREVVRVRYDPDRISEAKIVAEAKKQDCADAVFTRDQPGFKPDRQPQYYLLHSPFKFVPMLPLQASRVNSALGLGKDPLEYLSPRQVGLYHYFKSHPEKGNPQAYRQADFKSQWETASALLRQS